MTTILHSLASWADKNPSAIAQRYLEDGQWKPITARDYADRVYALALFLESKGMTKKDISVIVAYNSPEWVHLDLAPMLMGAKSAGVYPNSTGKDIHYILNHTDSRFLFVQNKEYYEKITAVPGAAALLDKIQLIVVFDGNTSISPKAISYQAALAEGRKLARKTGVKKVSDYLDQLDPLAGAFLIYTSGTTGNPKAALLSHDNLIFAIQRVQNRGQLPEGGETVFSFLPLCHIAEKLQNIGAGIYLRYTVNFASKFDNVGTELPQVSPTLLLCVPRLWEKMMEGVLKKVGDAQGAKKQLAEWALSVGARVAELRFAGKSVPILDQIQLKLADRLVLKNIRKALGLSQTFLAASGAAMLPPHVCRWFRSIGLEIIEVYGQTETAGVLTITERNVESAGTVGRPVEETEFKIAEDGEILTAGRHVFIGYYKDDAATAQVLIDKWLHTGDLGELTEQGLLRIRGRKKEIMKTSGGKMVAPLHLEEALKTSPIISQVCIVGDNRKFIAAIITLSESKLQEAKKINPPGEFISAPVIINEVKKYVDDLNATLAGYEKIKKFAVLAREFSIEEGEMTPTLKMKRNVIEKRFQTTIDEFYQEKVGALSD